MGGAGGSLQVILGETTHLPRPCQVQGAPPCSFAGSTPPPTLSPSFSGKFPASPGDMVSLGGLSTPTQLYSDFDSLSHPTVL